jgi:hypothetical protein
VIAALTDDAEAVALQSIGLSAPLAAFYRTTV